VSSRRTLAAHGLRPKKSFGQNFLDDPRLCARIAELATTPPGGRVVEIGAGLGALTAPLLERAAEVVAIERDRDLVPLLRERFADEPRLTLLEADAATVDIPLEDGPAPRVLAGNLPYQITGRLIARAVALAEHLDRAVFMVQREVAVRLSASPGGGDYGVSTVFTQAAFEVERALKVPAGAFHPPPKVDSAVLVLTPRRPPIAREDEVFRAVVKQAFGQRRKTLRNNWKGLCRLDRDQVAAAAAQAGISLDARAETIPVRAFAAMADAIRNAT
jgi:16S rRNA (adenine1518-N6/adenine1519-N6)-dimethyltransferase